jgi:quinol monooxygenase YgiN
LVQDLGNPDVIIYSEEWQSPHDFENHIRSPRYHVLLNIIDLSIQQPEVKITTTMQEWGMEYIEAIRLAK